MGDEFQEFKCDFCGKTSKFYSDDEDGFIPKKWATIEVEGEDEEIGHICEDCIPKSLKKRQKQ